jgi:hypothetical protein
MQLVGWAAYLRPILEATVADSNTRRMVDYKQHCLDVYCAARHIADDTGNFTLMEPGEIRLPVQNLVNIVRQCRR